MLEKKRQTISRRDFIKATGAGALAARLGPSIIIPGKAKATKNTLKIIQLSHPFPEYDSWFIGEFTKEWEDKYGIKVIVDITTRYSEFSAHAKHEVAAQKGHDLFLFITPPTVYEDQVIDHREIVEEVERKHGKMLPFAERSIYNPETRKYFGLAVSFTPTLVSYRQDLWDEVNQFPDTWDNTRVGGAKIKKKHDNPVGIGLASEVDTNISLRAIMYSFGSLVQDEKGNVVINSKQTVEAIKFVRTLYKEALAPDVFTWKPASNNQLMQAGRISLALDDIIIARVAERKKLEIANKILLTKPPEGRVTGIAPWQAIQVYVIWKFAQNKGAAKQFLIDFIDKSESAFIASGYYNIPCFLKIIPELENLIPDDKYKILKDASDWTTNIGYPGYFTAAIDEVYNTWVISTMFAEAARGKLSPEEAARAAEKKIKRIFSK